MPGVQQELLEKPASKEDNLRMLLDLNGGVCEVVTGVVLSELVPLISSSLSNMHFASLSRLGRSWICH